MHGVHAIPFCAQLAARDVAEFSAFARHADERDRRQRDESFDAFCQRHIPSIMTATPTVATTTPASASPQRSAHAPVTFDTAARVGSTSSTMVAIVAISYAATTSNALIQPSGAAANSNGMTATHGSAEKSRNKVHAVEAR